MDRIEYLMCLLIKAVCDKKINYKDGEILSDFVEKYRDNMVKKHCDKLENKIDKLIDILIGGGTLGDTCLKKCPFKTYLNEDNELICFEECKDKRKWREFVEDE